MRATHRAFNKDDPKARFYLCDYPNCAFLSETGGCVKLNVSECIGSACTFMKTKNELAGIDTKWQKRMLSLDADKQAAISKKYYSGKMPWKTSGSLADNKNGGK